MDGGCKIIVKLEVVLENSVEIEFCCVSDATAHSKVKYPCFPTPTLGSSYSTFLANLLAKLNCTRAPRNTHHPTVPQAGCSCFSLGKFTLLY